jgi:hypothetical protein
MHATFAWVPRSFPNLFRVAIYFDNEEDIGGKLFFASIQSSCASNRGSASSARRIDDPIVRRVSQRDINISVLPGPVFVS